MNVRVKEQFNTLSQDYDARRRLLIPDFDDFYTCGLNLLSFPGESPRVLDVGAGTGIYSSALLSRYPKAKLTLIDFAENMLDIAKEKFSGCEEASFLLDDYFTHDYGDGIFDIIISALSIHHLDAHDKQAYYAKLYSLLEDGGELINADIISSGSPETDAVYDELWTDFVTKNIGEGEYLERFKKSKDIDKPSSLEEQFSWLREAGFKSVDCVFKRYNFAVLYAKR